MNHYEHHREFTRKDTLFNNMQYFMTLNNTNVFDYIPITFEVLVTEGKNYSLESSLKKFQLVYDILEHFSY